MQILERVSFVISTLGRSSELHRLLDSIESQSIAPFEVIIVDQNEEEHISSVLESRSYNYLFSHIRTPKERGISRGRNKGWREASGDFVIFPDDDCWYPTHFVERALEALRCENVDFVTGRAADAETGRSINGRFEAAAQLITRRNIWTTQIEWAALFKKEALLGVNGYDEDIGIGADTPWQACEGQDIAMRCIEAGFSGYYDPALFGHHAELNIATPDRTMRQKGLKYARGHGFVLRRHGFSTMDAVYWACRSLLNATASLGRLQLGRAAYYGMVARGRLEGYFNKTIT